MTTASRGTSLVGNAILDACRKLKEDLGKGGLESLVGRSYRGHWAFEDSTAPGQPGEIVTHYSYGYATQLVVLDDEGEIEKIVAAHDAGRVINPVLFRGQIEGAVHMGLGYALSENLPLENGRPVSTRLSRLGLIPMHEMPEVVVVPVEVPDPLGPYGAKGVGEIGLVPTAAAVANALADFEGVRRDRLPLRPPRRGRR